MDVTRIHVHALVVRLGKRPAGVLGREDIDAVLGLRDTDTHCVGRITTIQVYAAHRMACNKKLRPVNATDAF